MVAPPPFKYKCPKCGYSKIIKPKSDVLTLDVLNSHCPKCKVPMDTKPLNWIESLLSVSLRKNLS